MISKIPIIGSPLGYRDVVYALQRIRSKSLRDDFGGALAGVIRKRRMYLTNSGITAFFIILKALKENSNRHEVVLPAYTAGSLVTAVVKAGLKPVLCDITLGDFNLDRDALCKTISRDTLAVVCVHMFGIGIHDIAQLRKRIPPDIFLLEDCAQSMGSKIENRQTGGFGDISFFSFNRGKNMPLYRGGGIAADSEELLSQIGRHIDKISEEGLSAKSLLPLKAMMLSLAVKPFVYGLTYPLISQFKDTRPPEDIILGKFTNFQAGLGLALLGRMEELCKRRYLNGTLLIEALRDCEGVIVPNIPIGSEPAFNRLPVVIKDIERMEKIKQRLWRAGIESSQLYLKPLHHMFDLGYRQEDFPLAVYVARHLLTLPVHPLVREKDVLKMAEILKSVNR